MKKEEAIVKLGDSEYRYECCDSDGVRVMRLIPAVKRAEKKIFSKKFS